MMMTLVQRYRQATRMIAAAVAMDPLLLSVSMVTRKRQRQEQVENLSVMMVKKSKMRTMLPMSVGKKADTIDRKGEEGKQMTIVRMIDIVDTAIVRNTVIAKMKGNIDGVEAVQIA